MSKQKLYLCDGYACDEHHKAYCYMNGGECRHTSHIEHSISKLTPDFPSTKFIPHGNSLFEEVTTK